MPLNVARWQTRKCAENEPGIFLLAADEVARVLAALPKQATVIARRNPF